MFWGWALDHVRAARAVHGLRGLCVRRECYAWAEKTVLFLVLAARMFRTRGRPAFVILISIDENFWSRAKIFVNYSNICTFVLLAEKENFVYDFAFEARCQDPLYWLRSSRQDHLLRCIRQFVVSSERSGNLCVGFWECERCSLYEYSVIETGPMYVYCGLRELCLSWERCAYFEKLVHVWKFCAHARNEKQMSWCFQCITSLRCFKPKQSY